MSRAEPASVGESHMFYEIIVVCPRKSLAACGIRLIT